MSTPITVKLILLGDSRVGKSSLIIRFVKNEFDHKFPSIGATFLTKSVSVDDYVIQFEIWDLHCARVRWRSPAPLYYRGASAGLVVYDITNRESFENARQWIEEMQCREGKHVIIGLIGNKVDLDANRKVSFIEGEDLAEKYISHSHGLTQDKKASIVSGYIHQQCYVLIPEDLIHIFILFYGCKKNFIFFETSAKDSINVREVFTSIAQQIPNIPQLAKQRILLIEPEPEPEWYTNPSFLLNVLCVTILICSYFIYMFGIRV
eukprot:108242_1